MISGIARAVHAREVGQLRARVPPTGASMPGRPLEAVRQRPHVVDDLVLARVVGRDVGHHQDARLAAAVDAVDEPGDRVALVDGRAVEPRGDQVARAGRSPGDCCSIAAQAAQRRERAAALPQLVADGADPASRQRRGPAGARAAAGAARAPFASSSSPPVASSDCAPPARPSSCGWTAAMPSRACPSAAASSLLTARDGAQAGVHEPPGAVGDLLASRRRTARPGGRPRRPACPPPRPGRARRASAAVQPRERTGLRGLRSPVPATAAERGDDVLARLLDRRVRAARRGRARPARPRARAALVCAGIRSRPSRAWASRSALCPVTIVGIRPSTRARISLSPSASSRALRAERLRSRRRARCAPSSRRRQPALQPVDVAGAAARGSQHVLAPSRAGASASPRPLATSPACRRASPLARLELARSRRELALGG